MATRNPCLLMSRIFWMPPGVAERLSYRSRTNYCCFLGNILHPIQLQSCIRNTFSTRSLGQFGVWDASAVIARGSASEITTYIPTSPAKGMQKSVLPYQMHMVKNTPGYRLEKQHPLVRITLCSGHTSVQTRTSSQSASRRPFPPLASSSFW